MNSKCKWQNNTILGFKTVGFLILSKFSWSVWVYWRQDNYSSVSIKGWECVAQSNNDWFLIFLVMWLLFIWSRNSLYLRKINSINFSQEFTLSEVNQVYNFVIPFKNECNIVFNTLRTGLLNCLNAHFRVLTFRHRASWI